MAESIVKIQRIEVPLQDLLDLYISKYSLTAQKLSSYGYDKSKEVLFLEVSEVSDSKIDVPS